MIVLTNILTLLLWQLFFGNCSLAIISLTIIWQLFFGNCSFTIVLLQLIFLGKSICSYNPVVAHTTVAFPDHGTESSGDDGVDGILDRHGGGAAVRFVVGLVSGTFRDHVGGRFGTSFR